MLADLSDKRVTQAICTKDGTQDARRDKRFELRDGARVPASSTTFAGRGEWSGVTWFFHKDANREAGVPRRRFMTNKYDSRSDKEVDVLQRLRTGAGEGRDLLAFNVSVAGIEWIQLAAAQRQCPEFGPVYTAVLAKQTEGLDPRGELVALKEKGTGSSTGGLTP